MSASIHSSGIMFLGRSHASKRLEEDSGRQGGHVQKQRDWTNSPADLTYDAGPLLGGLDPPTVPSPGTPSPCSYLPTGDTLDFFVPGYPVRTYVPSPAQGILCCTMYCTIQDWKIISCVLVIPAVKWTEQSPPFCGT